MARKKNDKYPVKTEVSETRTIDGKLVRVTVTSEPVEIDYRDILGATEVVPDNDYHEAPWESCDGWGHHLEHASDHLEGYSDEDAVIVDHETQIVVLDDDPIVTWGFTRDPGEAKQVWLERVAVVRRGALDQLVRWYTYGWAYWGVTCSFKSVAASVWGIDDDEYATREVRGEIAEEVASNLEKEGYVITNRPAPDRGHIVGTVQNKLFRIAHHLGFKDVGSYRSWVSGLPLPI